MEIFLKLDNFEGPFDLLISLIEKNKVNISEISINKLIDDYLEVLNSYNKNDNAVIKSEFLVMASELIDIKAISLLNLDKEKRKEKELIRRIEDYKLLKEITHQISEIENEYRVAYSRGEAIREIKKIKKDYELKDIVPSDVYDNFNKYIKENDFLNKFNIDFEKKYSLQNEMDNIYLRIFEKNKSFEEIFDIAENKMHLIYIFLAILELYKDSKISIENGEISKK